MLHVDRNSYETATALAEMSQKSRSTDLERVQRGMDFVADHIDASWIAEHSKLPVEVRLSPAAFCYRLTELARNAQKRIVLPEGNEPRTIRAAAICAERGIARCVLLGDRRRKCGVWRAAQSVELPDSSRSSTRP